MKKKPKLKMSQAEREALLKEVRDNIDDSWQHDRDNRRESATDLAFLANDQWPDAVRRERQSAGRPFLTINVLPQFVRQVTNDIRQADLAIKVAPVDDSSDPALAKIYNGLIRQIQYQSSAAAVYAQGAEHQASCGIGHWRLVTDYTDDSAFEQEIRIKAIRNPLSVYWDPGAIEPDRSDAMWCAITELWPKSAFKAKWPDAVADEITIPQDENERRVFWTQADTVRVAEYWRKVPYTKTLALLETGESVDITGKGEGELGMLPIVRVRELEAFRVEQYIVSGSAILEGPNPWAGKYIPIVPVIGGEFPLEGKTYRYGVIRFARDGQQLYNYYRTATAEAIALAPKAPYLITPSMIEGYESFWENANRSQKPYLPYNPDPEAPGARPTREHPPEVPAALIQEALTAYDDIKKTTGIYDAGLGAKGNEQSGRAILARQKEGDVSNFHFTDNLQRSLEYTGRILIDLIPKVYDNQRVVRLMGDDEGQEEFVPINVVTMSEDGLPHMYNDLSAARFDVRVTIGPSFSTKRMETAESLVQFAQAVPQVGQVAPDLIAKALDFEGAEEVAKRLRNTIPPEILADPDDPNTQPPNPMDNPMAQLELRGKAAQAAKLEAEAEGKHLENFALYGQMTAPPGVFGDMGLPQEQGPMPMGPGEMPDGPPIDENMLMQLANAPPPDGLPPGPAAPF